MPRPFHTFDVFTDRRYAGNPLAIVEDADGLDDEAMQTIAGEFNLSETVFLFPPDNAAHTARVRIFTPSRELPFAGHPTVGTAIFLAMKKFGKVEKEEDAIIVLEEEIGPVRTGVRLRPDEAPFAEFDVPQIASEAGTVAARDKVAAALGLAPEDIGFENHVPTVYSAGNPFTFVPVRNLHAIARAQTVTQHWEDGFGTGPASSAFVYTRETINHEAAFHARMFAPMLGISEDPATGSAAAAFAGIIMRFDEPRDGNYTGIIEQGYEMGRPSEMTLELEVARGALTGSRIGGHAVPVMQGSLND